jgi:hemolysin D
MNTVPALGDLARRYAQILTAAWKVRHELDAVPRLRRESEFLPATLALRDTPVHPAPRIAMGVIIALLMVALAWSCLGRVDVVATAAGKIIPNGYVKTIQAEETAVVTAIYVHDGERVKRGDVLLDLNATEATANVASDQSGLYATRDEVARAQAMLKAISDHQRPQLQGGPALGPPAELVLEQQVLVGEYADYTSNVGRLDASIAQNAATLRETDAEIRKLEQTLPLEESKEQSYVPLISKGYVSKNNYYSEEQAVIQIQQDLAAQQAKRGETQAALEAAVRERSVYVDNTRRTWLEKIHDDDQKIGGLVQDLVKATQQQSLMHLTSPVAGTVQHLAVHTLGGVVTPAQTLMTVVPDDQKLLVEAIVNNQDIGFVKDEQRAEIKVETFPFTRYGTLHGTVVQVSNDAQQDDKLGLIYTAEIVLPRDKMHIDDRWIHLTPGMAVTAEIKTGRRRIVSYLLSPLIQHARNSFHER